MTVMKVRVTRREKAGLEPSEHVEAVRLMRMVRLHEGRLPALLWFHAIPNGGWRKKAVAAKMKAEGVRAGVHDYCWPYKQGEYSGLYIELKSMTGRPTKEQREFGEFVTEQGFKIVYCRGWEAAWKAVCDYAGLPYRVQ